MSSLRLPDDSYLRRTDVLPILQRLSEARCVELTGFSNVGKSALMRLLAQPDVWIRELGEVGNSFLPVYIDCNRMVEMTDQGFYELVLRCLQECSPPLRAAPELQSSYETLVAPASEFQVPLSFNRGLNAAIQATQHTLVLLFDEFDEPFQQIDSRVFLNLRAKKDRHSTDLVYVTATGRSLDELHTGDHCAEFCELFAHQAWRLAPLTRSDVERYAHYYAVEEDVQFTPPDVEFIYGWTGGHPGMLQGLCHRLAAAVRSVDAGADPDHWMLHRRLAPLLRQDANLQGESVKIWESLTATEQEALLALFAGQEVEDDIVDDLRQRHLLIQVEGKPRAFSRLFAAYLQQKQSTVAQQAERLWVDVDSGEVLIDGQPTDTLTRLEYQLMLLLFENTDKIVDKYQIVSGVWGDDYLDEVDDARIEKLVSRLRQKVEPDPGAPQFVTTVRGRGYRLVSS